MAKLSTDELIESFKEMPLIELSEFVKLFEDTFGVTAAAPVAVAAAGGGTVWAPSRARWTPHTHSEHARRHTRTQERRDRPEGLSRRLVKRCPRPCRSGSGA